MRLLNMDEEALRILERKILSGIYGLVRTGDGELTLMNFNMNQKIGGGIL